MHLSLTVIHSLKAGNNLRKDNKTKPIQERTVLGSDRRSDCDGVRRRSHRTFSIHFEIFRRRVGIFSLFFLCCFYFLL